MCVEVVDEERETRHAHVTIVVQSEVNVGQRETETFVPGERDSRCGYFHFADARDDRLTVESGCTGRLVPFDDDVYIQRRGDRGEGRQCARTGFFDDEANEWNEGIFLAAELRDLDE